MTQVTRLPDRNAVAAAQQKWPRAFGAPPLERFRNTMGWLLFAGAVIYGFWHVGFFDLPRLIE